MDKLLIIESPNKINTISKYLDNKEFNIMATVGHIRDLPSRSMGFNERSLEPKWIIPKKKKNEKESKQDIVNAIKEAANKSSEIYLATDPDREGEAISWHVYSILSAADKKKCKRITFNEITKDAILEALQNPRELDLLWVNSQFARRILDRLVGYKVSKLVRQKVHGKSAGRVQSVALDMIYDREQQIKKFKPTKWYTVDPVYNKKTKLILREVNPKLKDLKIVKQKNESDVSGIDFKDEASAIKVKESLSNKFKLYALDDPRTFKVNPKEPYKTSTLQQDGVNRLKWNVNRVTSVAQKLYEGVKIDGEYIALISYPRTDSVRIADTFAKKLKQYIIKNYGEKYYQEHEFTNKGSNEKNVQDAHEAIRVIDLKITPTSIKKKVDRETYLLYDMIWKRTIAAFMSSAIYENTIARFINNKNKFYTYSRVIKFDGYKKVYNDLEPITERDLKITSRMLGKEFKIPEIVVQAHETQPPARFNQATLIKELDNAGVGRPSTYKSMAGMAVQRGYARLNNRAYEMTELGNDVVKFLKKYFKFIVDKKFTSQVEDQLDKIASGDVNWKKLIRQFQPILKKDLAAAKKVKTTSDKVNRKCPKCGHELVYRFNKKSGARFIGCSNFPNCRYIEMDGTNGPMIINLDVKCPECNKPLLIRYNRRHQKFIGCSGYPKCKYIMKATPDQIREMEEKHTVDESKINPLNQEVKKVEESKKANKENISNVN